MKLFSTPETALNISPITVGIYIFAASQFVPISLPHAVIAAAAIGGGCAVYRRLPEPVREKARTKYDAVKSLLQERFAQANCKIKDTARETRIRIQQIVANGTVIILIWAAFIGETFRNFIETIRVCSEVWTDGQEPVFAMAA